MRTASGKHSPPLCVKLSMDALAAHRFMPAVLSPHRVRRQDGATMHTANRHHSSQTRRNHRDTTPCMGSSKLRRVPASESPQEALPAAVRDSGSHGRLWGSDVAFEPYSFTSPARHDPYRCLQKGCPQLLEARQTRRFTASAHEPPKNLTFRREPVMHDIQRKAPAYGASQPARSRKASPFSKT